MLEYRASDLVKLDMLINGDPIDAFSVIIHTDKSYEWGRKIADKLKDLIPRSCSTWRSRPRWARR
jgi:GTP-binding protein LepA